MYSKFEGAMCKKINYKYIVFFFFYLQIVIIHSQTHSENKDYYNWFDSIIGLKNSGIYNGIIYNEKFRTIDDNHKFYKTSKFINGNIIYKGQPYYNIEMKYDIYEDKLIVKLPSHSAYIIIQLINDKIDEFFIKNHQFIKISNKYEEFFNESLSGFYEILNQSKQLNLLKKHRKSRKKRLGQNFVYSQFKDQSEYFISFNGKFYKINSKNEIKKLFPEFEKDINRFYNSNKRLLKSDQDTFMNYLIKHINSLTSNLQVTY